MKNEGTRWGKGVIDNSTVGCSSNQDLKGSHHCDEEAGTNAGPSPMDSLRLASNSSAVLSLVEAP